MDAGKALFCSFGLTSMNNYEVDEDTRAIRCSNLNEPKDVTKTNDLFLNIYQRLMVVWTQKHTHRPVLCHLDQFLSNPNLNHNPNPQQGPLK